MRSELTSLGIKSPWAAWLAAKNFVKTVWDPTRSDIQHGINALVYEALAHAPPGREAEVARENPELAALFREGYDPTLEPERLAALPEGTLGREYARFIRANQIDPLGNLLALSRPKNLLEYQFWRAYKLHDVLHIVLGCDATVLGEVPIVAYSLGQARSTGVRAPAMALMVLLLHLALRKTDEFQPALRLAAKWMAIGERTRGYATHRMEDWMERPVSEVREIVLGAAA
jgi:ubiquinone biosynthesis protein COQ4